MSILTFGYSWQISIFAAYWIKMGVFHFPKLDRQERKAFSLHMLYSIFEGVILGVFTLNEFVFLKSMLGSNYQMSFLFIFSMGVFVFLIFFNEFLRRIQDKRKMLRYTALLSRLPLFLVILFPVTADGYSDSNLYHYIFLGIFLIYYMGTAIIYPTTNLLLKNSYKHVNFGNLFSWATSANKIVMLLAAFIYGAMLDKDAYVFVKAYPLVGVLGVISLILLSFISYQAPPIIEERKGIWQSAMDSIKRMTGILKNNKPYLDFEIGFLMYGIAFMLSINVIHIYFKDELQLNYNSVAFYRNSYYIITIFLLPLFGKLIGKIDPRKFAAITFGSMLLYFFFLTITQHFPAHFYMSLPDIRFDINIFSYKWEVYIPSFLKDVKVYYYMLPYIAFHSIFAATMGLLWSIGSAYFCKKEDAGDYQSVHLSLTGIRAWIAPLFGILIYEVAGFTVTFSISMVFLLVGVLFMLYSYRKHKNISVQD